MHRQGLAGLELGGAPRFVGGYAVERGAGAAQVRVGPSPRARYSGRGSTERPEWSAPIGRAPSAGFQPVVYSGNQVRLRKNGPAVEGGAAIAKIVDEAAACLGLPSTELRGQLAVRLADGLVVRHAPKILGAMSVTVPGRATALPVKHLVLGRFEGVLGGRLFPAEAAR